MSRKHRVHGRNGLFEFDLEGGVRDVPDNPLCRRCPTCAAAPRQQCTSPSMRPGGRRTITRYHDARTQTPQETPDA
jgi:hypothetical protein